MSNLESKVLVLLMKVYQSRKKGVSDFSKVMKSHGLNTQMTSIFIDKGLMVKERGGRILEKDAKGPGITFFWKNPDVGPSLNMAQAISKCFKESVAAEVFHRKEKKNERRTEVDTLIQSEVVETVPEKEVAETFPEKVMKIDSVDNSANLHSELKEVKERYQKLLGNLVEINILVEIKTNQTFSL